MPDDEKEFPKTGRGGVTTASPVATVAAERASPVDEPDDDGGEANESVAVRSTRYWLDVLEGRERIPDVGQALCVEIEARAQRATSRLKTMLSGRYTVNFTDTGKQILVDLRTSPVAQKGVGASPASSSEVDGEVELEQGDLGECEITLTTQNLLRIAAGELNPQVAMLSDKIKVGGKIGLGVYFFNLVAPRPSA